MKPTLSMVCILAFAWAVVACGEQPQQPRVVSTQETPAPVVQAKKADAVIPTPLPPTPSPIPTPENVVRVVESVAHGYAPPNPSTLEERILMADVVVRARFRSVSPSSRSFYSTAFLTTYHVPFVHFSFEVLESLKGTAGNSAVVELRVNASSVLYDENRGSPFADTATEAVSTGQDWIDNDFDQEWNNREALLFLKTIANAKTTKTTGRPASVQYVFVGSDSSKDASHISRDSFSVSSPDNRAWLPAEVTSEAEGASSTRSYLLGVSDDAETDPPTITLATMKSTIATTVEAIDPTIEGHKECLIAKKRSQRQDAIRLPEFQYERTYEAASGLPANVVVMPGGGSATQYSYDHLYGTGISLFTATTSDSDTDPVNGYRSDIKQTRPLAKGDYVFELAMQLESMIPCNYIPDIRGKWTINVVPPEGTLHELFFDPVTAVQGQSGPAKVAADASNGVLEPSSFTDANGASATIQSVSYDPPSGGSGQSGADSESGTGTVAMKLTTHTGLANHALDFIALDGSVSLSLNVDDATVDAPNNTLSWTVSEQPWHGDDKLMVRIRKVLSAPEDVSVSLSGGTYTISWSAVTGAADYRAQYRTGGSEAEWTDLDVTTATSQTFSPEGGVACSTTYEFRVQARGDGTTYPAEWSPLSESTSHTNSAGACNRPPVFDSATYTFTVSEDASVWPDSHVVGSLSASDPDEGDGLLYYITAGNVGGAFNISTGHHGADILVWAALDYETTSSYTLTVEARDGKAGGTSSATVEISVTDVAE